MEGNTISKLQELVSNARKALAAGDRISTRQYGEMLIAGFPKSEEGWLVLASISEPEEALTHLENALRVNPGSQAARQGIRLVTSQFLKENQSVEEITKKRELEDTQPIKVNEYSVVEVDSRSEYDDLDELVSAEPAQEISSPESDQVTTEEALVETESMPEDPVKSPFGKEFSETIPDLPTQKYDVAQESVSDKHEPLSCADKIFAKKKFRFRKKPIEKLGRPEADSNKPERTHWKFSSAFKTKGGGKKRDRYIPVLTKFVIGSLVAVLWVAVSIYLSRFWLRDLAIIVSLPVAILILIGIAYVPGYLNAMLVISLLLDKQPSFKNLNPECAMTILLAARNEGKRIQKTLLYISKQDYAGKIKVLVVDNNSIDDTVEKVKDTGRKLKLHIQIIKEKNPGKFNALNAGLKIINTDLMITLDADTLLHKSAVRFIVARLLSAPKEVCAVASSVLVQNSRDNMITKLQEWDYFLSISSIKRYQGLFQGTLVAQGAFSLYRTQVIKEVGGWPNAIGEDIVLTWNFLKKNYKVYFEPLAVSFTEVPNTFKHLIRQRSRWARGMIEALKVTKPWEQPNIYLKYLTGVDLFIPYLDFIFTFCWLPGLILAFFGIFWVVGPMTLLVLPLTFASYYILYRYQLHIFKELDLRVRNNLLGFFLFILGYQILMSPIAVWGYIQEFFGLDRIWS